MKAKENIVMKPMECTVIDVREKDEFNAEHVEGAIHLPLSSFKNQAPAILKVIQSQAGPNQKPLFLMCRSGKRAEIAKQEIGDVMSDLDGIEVYPGGILGWKKNGNPVTALNGSTGTKVLPIMRQVQVAAGSLVLGSLILSQLVNPLFIFLAGFVGAGLWNGAFVSTHALESGSYN
jgi:rhodanese-related sulfurtransferase